MKDSEKPKPTTLFLCWSGWRSKRIAECFEDYFNALFERFEEHHRPQVVMSDTLIEKGVPWRGRLLNALKEAWAGIVCLTPENRNSAWLHFEGGALASHELLGRSKKAESKTPTNTGKLFSFLFTMDNTHVEGPLSLFQTTIYRRDYNRDREELVRLTNAVVQIFGRSDCFIDDNSDLYIIKLVAKLRELHFLPFRDIVPELEQQARLIIQAVEDLDPMPNRVQALSAMLSLHSLLEDRRRELEVICPPSQFMFFERLVEMLVIASRGLEQAVSEGSETIYCRLTERVAKLRRILEAAIEPLVPLLDDAWRYSFYAQHEQQQDALRKQKLLLIHPLESTLKRAVLDGSLAKDNRTSSGDDSNGDQGDDKPKVMHLMMLQPKRLLSPMEKRRALRSFWPFDRIAAYIHYSEDRLQPTEKELKESLMELTRAVLKEIALLEVPLPISDEKQKPDDLPLRFALRALLGKIKIGIGYGRHTPDSFEAVLDSGFREVIESRIKSETGLSYAGINDLLKTLRKLQKELDFPSSLKLKSPIESLCDDFERLLSEPGSSKVNPPGFAPVRNSEAADLEA